MKARPSSSSRSRNSKGAARSDVTTRTATRASREPLPLVSPFERRQHAPRLLRLPDRFLRADVVLLLATRPRELHVGLHEDVFFVMKRSSESSASSHRPSFSSASAATRYGLRVRPRGAMATAAISGPSAASGHYCAQPGEAELEQELRVASDPCGGRVDSAMRWRVAQISSIAFLGACARDRAREVARRHHVARNGSNLRLQAAESGPSCEPHDGNPAGSPDTTRIRARGIAAAGFCFAYASVKEMR